MRIKFVKDYHQYTKGQVIQVTSNIGVGFVDKGLAIISKDMTPNDYSTKRKKLDGNTTVVRPN